MENKKNSNSILLTVIGVATLLVALIGATFAYFTASSTSSNQNVEAGKLTISTVLGATSQNNIIPTTWDNSTMANNLSNDNIAKFTYTVDSTGTTVRGSVYDLKLTGAVTTTTVNNGVTSQGGDESEVLFKLVKDSSVVAQGNYSEIKAGKNILTGQTIPVNGASVEYTLCVYIEESGENQDKLQGATVSATMDANAYSPKPAGA